MVTTNLTSGVDERPAAFAADDGVSLVGSWFGPTSALPSSAVVIVCGAGIPARFYRRLARYLAERGAAVLTFDYRGIGASRTGSLRKMTSGMDDWAARDIGAAVATASAAILICRCPR